MTATRLMLSNEDVYDVTCLYSKYRLTQDLKTNRLILIYQDYVQRDAGKSSTI